MNTGKAKLKSILVTGATGYVGARLVPRLLEADYHVRATARSEPKLASRHWSKHANVEIVRADMFDREAVLRAMKGCSIAYYLIHSMNAENRNFVDADRRVSESFAAAAHEAGIERIIYLGGLGEESANLSKHLKSRAQVGQILQSGKVPVTVLRAAMIIGSGSASFEILRYLVERLPIMITPKWVRVESQPIAIRNVLEYLIGCLEKEETAARVFDIGGPEIITYQDLMNLYAEEAGLTKRIIVPVPLFTPWLSSYWIHFVTPVPSYLARPLAEGLRNPAICKENSIREIIPTQLLDCRTAIKLAIEQTQLQTIESHWTDAGAIPRDEWASTGDPAWAGGTYYEDKRRIVIAASPTEIWAPLVKVGGKTGWYYGTWLWELRGLLDRILGGVGLHRGRRNATELSPGDALDFWRVAFVERDSRLSLVAEMKLPGKAILEFQIRPLADGQSELCQIARFRPSGLSGIAYWKLVSPLHDLIFDGMLRGIAHASGKNILAGPTRD